MKFSDNPEKTTNPGVKNVWRLYDEEGMAKADIVALAEEEIVPGKEYCFHHPSGDYRQFHFTPAKVEPLLIKQIEKGKRVTEKKDDREVLKEARETMRQQLEKFHCSYKRLLNPHIYKVSITDDLQDMKLEFIKTRIK